MADYALASNCVTVVVADATPPVLVT